jgi:asparagine synthase (glutamine-hydrolysing)
MCGISGILNFDGSPVNPEQIRKMNRALIHRGPDDEGVYCDGPIGMGARRLSIFDLSSAGHQPMVSADQRFVVTYNGEIYNWPEIRRELKFRNWRSQSDTETILQAYVERGPECLEMFNGMFAIAIWDRHQRTLFLARDRVGIKPLFIAQQGNRFLFASEAKAMFAVGHPIQPNEGSVWDFLRWGLVDHDSETFFQNVFHFEPATWMQISADGQRKVGRYWNIAEIVKSRPTISADEATEQYAAGLKKSIALNCRSDVPVCAFLSGGVDSTILISFMVQQNLPNLCAFTYDFDTGDTGERLEAKRTADRFGVEHDYATLEHSEVPEYHDKVLYFQEYPLTSMRVISHYKLYARARDRGYTVILDGNGGDQTGGGFEYYWLSAVMDSMRHDGYYAGVKTFHQFMDMYGIPQERRLERLLGCLSGTISPGVCTQDGVPFADPAMLSPEFRAKFRSRFPKYVRPFDTHVLNAQYIDLTCHNQRRVLRMSDRCAMGVGREQRVPVLDHNLIELGFCSAHDARVSGVEKRHYMRQAARKLVPDDIFARPKRSIVDPQRKWLKEELRDWVGDVLHSQSFSELGIFDVKAVRDEFARYVAYEGIPPSSFHLFQYVNVGLWYSRIVNGDMYAGLGKPIAHPAGAATTIGAEAV